MGLSGRKTKQRIPDDPRNLCWADDAARFGSNYLAKFGWDPSTGLGVAGEGRTSHIKVSHKLDLLGIGAAQQKDPNGIAWKQNKDFELLLQRLNDASATQSNQVLESGKEEDTVNPDDCITKKKKKRHREEGESKTERKKQRKAELKIDNEDQLSSNAESATIQPEKMETVVVQVKKTVTIPRHRAHRARAINAKNISSKSAAHISEILGIAPVPSHSSSNTDSGEPSERLGGKLTSLTDQLEIEKVTISTKSVADYFKEKLNARSSSIIVSTSTTTPRDSDDSYDTPRMGLGSRARLEMLTTTGEVDQRTQKTGFMKASAFSLDLEDSAPTLQMDANPNPQTMDLERQKKKKTKTKDKEIEKEGGVREDKDETEERKDRKRKKRLDKGNGDLVDPQGSDDGLKFLKKEKRKGKEKNLQALVTSPDPVEEKPQKERKGREKGSKSKQDERT